METKNALYIVATPIGNDDDITIRAINTLKSADALICEEYRNGSRLLKKYDIPQKEIITLNEHDEDTQVEGILIRLAQGQNLALVCDCGTPLFSDPGHRLVEMTVSAGFKIVPIPGVSSLTTIISVTPVKLEKYVFGGFLPRDPNDRVNELKKLKAYHQPIILMDTPYRLTTLLENVQAVFGKGQNMTLGCDLTMPSEKIFTGTCEEIIKKAKGLKAEFMLVIHPLPRG